MHDVVGECVQRQEAISTSSDFTHNPGSHTEDGDQRLSGSEELGRGDGIVLVRVDGDVGKGLLEGVDDGAAGGNSWAGHVDDGCVSSG